MDRERIISGNEGESKMKNDLERLSKRSIAILAIIMPVSFLLALVIMKIIIPTMPWPPDPPLIGAMLVAPIVMVGFMIYSANLKDERTSLVSDKGARNGFGFVLYVLPLALVVLSLTGASFETVIALLLVWVGTVAVASISALYYYHR